MRTSIFIMLLTGSLCANAQLSLPTLFADNMVLQQAKPANIWGWAKPGAAVEITFNNKKYTAQANEKGEWKTQLAAAKPGSAGELIISSASEKKVIKNVLVGEVWICSGQSNMEFPLSGFKDLYKNEIANAKDDNLRYVVVKNTFSNKESGNAELKNSWTSIDSLRVGDCSAVAYFFGKKLREKLKVPIGLIVSSWGGTPAQAWVDTSTLEKFPDYQKLYNSTIRPIDFSKLEELKKQSAEAYTQKLSGSVNMFKETLADDYNDNNWETAHLPKAWEYDGHPTLDGVATYRISFDVPADAVNQPAVLHLPAIDDVDSTYINGKFVGAYNVWDALRKYKIPAGVLKAGKNIMSIWVEDTGGGGGLNEDPDNYYVEFPSLKIPLKGDAKFKLLAPLENIATDINYNALQNQPSVLFNGMIAPLLSYNMRGVIWYQGESNAPQFAEYRTLFPALITNWRNRFKQGPFPFLFVQLASFNPSPEEPALSDWAFLREAQAGALKLPNTGMAVTIDVGDKKDIHPKRKKEVGDRLAANALKIIYGQKNLVASGPMYVSDKISNDSITISFNNIGTGLMLKGKELSGFVIAGADKKFVKATATVSGNQVIVTNAKIKSPKYVRYAWANAPMDANLFNKEGFPAAPFRTDK